MNAVNVQGAQIMVVTMPNGQLMQLQPVGQAVEQAVGPTIGQAQAQAQAQITPQAASNPPAAYNPSYQGETMHME